LTNIIFNKIVTRSVSLKFLNITTLTLLILASTAASAGAVTINSVTFTPYPLIVGEPFSVKVQVSDFHPEDTILFSTSSTYVKGVSISSTGTASTGGRAVTDPGTYDYYVYVQHQLSPYSYNNEEIQKGTITVTAPPVKPTPTITWINPADIICGTALSGTQLNAVATDPVTGNTIPGTFAYTPASGTVLSAGVKILHVDFTPTNTAYYNTTSKEVTINVLKATPTINWNNPADIKYGTALSSIQLCASSLGMVKK
jgi:ribosomal protein S27E